MASVVEKKEEISSLGEEGTNEISSPGEEQQEAAEPSSSSVILMLSAVTGLAPSPVPSLGDVSSSPGPSGDCSSAEQDALLKKVQSVEKELVIFLNQSNILGDAIRGRARINRDLLIRSVNKLLSNSQPFFNQLESSARSTASQHQPIEICGKFIQYSQQLCDTMEQLLLACAYNGLVSLDESDALGLSHFCIGSSQLGQLRVTAYRYCRLSPYLVQFNLGLWKRMRWNVDRLRDSAQQQNDGHGDHQRQNDGDGDHQQKTIDGDGDQQQMDGPRGQKWHFVFDCDEQQPEDTVGETELYFLCYEEEEKAAGNQETTGQWSIGRWVQVYPDPDTETINDWILCAVPQGKYDKLLDLGREEPSSSVATDYMHQLLLARK